MVQCFQLIAEVYRRDHGINKIGCHHYRYHSQQDQTCLSGNAVDNGI